jgi:hypothetical protein
VLRPPAVSGGEPLRTPGGAWQPSSRSILTPCRLGVKKMLDGLDGLDLSSNSSMSSYFKERSIYTPTMSTLGEDLVVNSRQLLYIASYESKALTPLLKYHSLPP